MQTLDFEPLYVMQYDEESIVVAGDKRVVLYFLAGDLDDLSDRLKDIDFYPTGIVNDGGDLYLGTDKGVIRIQGISNLFGPTWTLLVPDTKFLQYDLESDASLVCSDHSPTFYERHLARYMRFTSAWVTCALGLIAFALLGVLLYRKHRD